MSEPLSENVSEHRQKAQAVVQAAEAAWRSHEPARLMAALQECDRTLQALPAERVAEGTGAPDPADELAMERWALWLWRGRLLVMADKPEVVVQGLQSLDQAIARLRLAGDRPEVGAALAVAWMNRGGGLFRLGSNEALAEAVRSYDQAISILEKLPGADLNTLGAAWMNRGVGLMNWKDVTETPESRDSRLAAADQALRRAVALLEPLAAGQPASLRNLASAWANLGMLLAGRPDAAGALDAHRKAVEFFRPLAPAGGEPARFELAARLFNLGQAAGAAGDTAAALKAGREALALAAGLGSEGPAFELALRARHALCVVLGGLVAAGGNGSPDRAARLAEAGDLVEDGLAGLAGRGSRATDAERQTGARLYEFGAWLYRTQQPQFLSEYLIEHLGTDPERGKIAAAAVQLARQAFVQRDFNGASHAGMESVLEALQELGQVEARLKELGIGG